MAPELSQFAMLAPIGFAVGAYGTLVGAGGGSVLVPVLLFLYPQESAATITAISLAVVFFNAYSGTIAYMRMGRVDYQAGTLFTIAGLPGAILGTVLAHQVPRALFDPLFGVLLVVLGIALVVSPMGTILHENETVPQEIWHRRMRAGSIGSAYIGILSSLLGIGGGIIHVPFLIRILKMPPHIATATSHFVLTFLALTATAMHLSMGEFTRGVPQTLCLAIGVMMGAPLGAIFSSRLQGSLLVRILAVALSLVGMRLLLRVVWPAV